MITFNRAKQKDSTTATVQKTPAGQTITRRGNKVLITPKGNPTRTDVKRPAPAKENIQNPK